MTTNYAPETLDPDDDDGTMPTSRDELAKAVVGHRIVSAERVDAKDQWGYAANALQLTLDTGAKVRLVEEGDCCAYTNVEEFLLHPERVEHAITGVGTTDGFTTWHIYADFGDVMELKVGWSCGNPFYYAYGFGITVEEVAS